MLCDNTGVTAPEAKLTIHIEMPELRQEYICKRMTGVPTLLKNSVQLLSEVALIYVT